MSTPDAKDDRTEALLDELAALEDRLDPTPVRRGHLVADVVLLVMVVLLGAALNWQLRNLWILAVLLVVVGGARRLIPHLTQRSLRKERDRLLEASNDAVEPSAPT
jgi:Flp pilus assembly protein TadB